jgi:hypothetical protein
MTTTNEPTYVEMLSALALVTMVTWIFITMLQDLSGTARHRGDWGFLAIIGVLLAVGAGFIG